MVPQSKPSAAQKVNTIRDQLLQAYIEKEQGESQVKAAVEKINALRNALTGVTVGQQLQQEINAEAQVPAPIEK